MKRLFFKIFLGLMFLSAVSGMAFAAQKYNLVLFYADWNVYSEKAITEMEKAIEESDDISFEKINIDDPKAFVRMKQLGVMPTSSIPYYFLMDKHKRVIFGSKYNQESAKTLSEVRKKRIDD